MNKNGMKVTEVLTMLIQGQANPVRVEMMYQKIGEKTFSLYTGDIGKAFTSRDGDAILVLDNVVERDGNQRHFNLDRGLVWGMEIVS